MTTKKKLITLASALAVIMTAIPLFWAYADRQAVMVTVDNMPVIFADQGPIMDDNRVLVPVRGVFEKMGFYVTWSPDTRVATLIRDDISIIIPAGTGAIVVNSQIIVPDVPQQMVNNRLMLPLRVISDIIGWDAAWDGNNRVARITSVDTARWASTGITIPNRQLTSEELNAWIEEYHAQGGMTFFELEVMLLVNLEREFAGLPPLSLNPALMIAARFKSQSMSNIGYFSHESPVYGHFTNIARQLFDYPLATMGENIAHGQLTPQEVVNDWMASYEHRLNILHESFTEIGVGFYNGHWTQKFGSSFN